MQTLPRLTTFFAFVLLSSLACGKPGDKESEDEPKKEVPEDESSTDTEPVSDVDCPINTGNFLVYFSKVGGGNCGLGTDSAGYYADAVCTDKADGSWIFTVDGMLTPLTCVPDSKTDFTCEGEDGNFTVEAEGKVSENGQRFEGEMKIAGGCDDTVAYVAVAN